jgi:hypothetical protein
MGIHDRDYMKRRRDEDDAIHHSSQDQAEDRAAGLLEKYPRLPWIVIGLIVVLGIVALAMSSKSR